MFLDGCEKDSCFKESGGHFDEILWAQWSSWMLMGFQEINWVINHACDSFHEVLPWSPFFFQWVDDAKNTQDFVFQNDNKNVSKFSDIIPNSWAENMANGKFLLKHWHLSCGVILHQTNESRETFNFKQNDQWVNQNNWVLSQNVIWMTRNLTRLNSCERAGRQCVQGLALAGVCSKS